MDKNTMIVAVVICITVIVATAILAITINQPHTIKITVPVCGDETCDNTENCNTCSKDCGCGSGYDCNPQSNLADREGCIEYTPPQPNSPPQSPLYPEPPTRIASGSSGFGSVRPKDWDCKSSTGDVQVQWVNGAGERITLLDTMPSGGCLRSDGTTPIVANDNIAATEVFTCTYNAVSGCLNVGSGNRFEATTTLAWQPAAGGISHTESGSVWKAAEA
jgi:hypothetical protein